MLNAQNKILETQTFIYCVSIELFYVTLYWSLLKVPLHFFVEKYVYVINPLMMIGSELTLAYWNVYEV